LLLTRVPESTTFFPYVTCRDTTTRGFADRMIGPGGLIPLVDHIEFESTELNRRYRIGTFKGQTSGNRLRQLFSPTLIDWMAHTAPQGLYFELFGGVLRLTVTSYVESEEQIARACELASHLVERIRAESLETAAPDGAPEFAVSSEMIEQERKRADMIAAAKLVGPPSDFSSAYEAIEPVVKEEKKGFFRKVFKSINRDEAADLALEAFMRGQAQRLGMEWERPGEFITRHAALPFPVGPLQTMKGTLPGLGVDGDLFLVSGGEFEDGLQTRAPGASMPWPDKESVLLVGTRTEDTPVDLTFMGGFPVTPAEGERRISDRSKRDEQITEELNADLGESAAVIARNCESAAALTPAMREWVQAPERGARATLCLGGGILALMSSPLSVRELSGATLDEFLASLAPLAGDASPV
jgi:hypothetical protein